MKTVSRSVFYPSRIALIGIALAITAVPLPAVEGAMGRTLPGIWIQPQGAAVGPAAGFSFTFLPIGYMGSIGGSRLLPIGGTIVSNVDADLSATKGNALMPGCTLKFK